MPEGKKACINQIVDLGCAAACIIMSCSDGADNNFLDPDHAVHL